jgi:uncharacterized protein (DUF1015 family)
MAVIKPFRGVRYNPQKFDDMHVVISQPHDRIDQARLEQYYALSPYNITHVVRVRHPDEQPASAQGTSIYARARQHYEQWLKEEILIREGQPALYAYEQTFSVDGRVFVRMGLLAAVELAAFDEGIILPHEETHSGPKADRLNLITTLPINAEPIFMLYPDSENKVNALIQQAIAGREPDIDTTEMQENAVRQRFWVITDPHAIQAIQDEMAPKRNLIIADGHHRYTTSLNYRNAQRAAQPDAPPTAGFNYITAALVSMDDPGLLILPTHREICNFVTTAPADIVQEARCCFEVSQASDLQACMDSIKADRRGHSFGFYCGPEMGYYVFSLKDSNLVYSMINGNHSNHWKTLSVSVLHEIVMEKVARIPYSGVESREMIRYRRDPQRAIDSVNRGEANFVFFLSPTRMEHVRDCVTNHELMPQKSTDFYPKIIAGLVIRPLDEVY